MMVKFTKLAAFQASRSKMLNIPTSYEIQSGMRVVQNDLVSICTENYAMWMLWDLTNEH